LKFLKTPASRETIAKHIDAQRSDLLEALLDLGVAVGELSFRQGVYGLKGKRAIALVQEVNDPFAVYLHEAVAYHGSVYVELARWIMGAPLGDYLEATADLIARSSRTLEPLLQGFVQNIVKVRKPRRLLEIGCGSGAYLRHAADANQALTGIGIDMQKVAVRQARENLRMWGFSDRFTIRHADIRTDGPGLDGPFDLITLYNNLYYFPPEERASLFAGLRPLLAPGGTLAVVSLMRDVSVSSRNFDIVLQSTKGCFALTDSEETVVQMRTAGFTSVEKRQLLASEQFAAVLAWA
jgi:4-hydroxy-2,2'-bipyrrole-5-carbaldehyde O-methyltransferase